MGSESRISIQEGKRMKVTASIPRPGRNGVRRTPEKRGRETGCGNKG